MRTSIDNKKKRKKEVTRKRNYKHAQIRETEDLEITKVGGVKEEKGTGGKRDGGKKREKGTKQNGVDETERNETEKGPSWIYAEESKSHNK